MGVLLKIKVQMRIKTVYLLQVKLHLPNRLSYGTSTHIRMPATKTQLGVINTILHLFHKSSIFSLTVVQKESRKALCRQIPHHNSAQDAPLRDRQPSEGSALCLQNQSSSRPPSLLEQGPKAVCRIVDSCVLISIYNVSDHFS